MDNMQSVSGMQDSEAYRCEARRQAASISLAGLCTQSTRRSSGAHSPADRSGPARMDCLEQWHYENAIFESLPGAAQEQRAASILNGKVSQCGPHLPPGSLSPKSITTSCLENSDVSDVFVLRSNLVLRSPRKELWPTATLSADVGVQCELADMFEPISHPSIRPSFANRTALRRWYDEAKSSIEDGECWRSRVCATERYSVESHFALFEAPNDLYHDAMALGTDALQALASRFFGCEVAGCAAGKDGTVCERAMHIPWNRVEERHVDVAVALAESLPVFRNALRSAAVQFFFMGFQGRPGALLLAVHEPRRWICRVFSAMDFAARLAHKGALPRALLAAIAARVYTAAPDPAACALQLFVTQQLRPRQILPQRQAVVLATVERLPAQLQRSVGTSLRPYDEVCFSRISLAPARYLCEEIP